MFLGLLLIASGGLWLPVVVHFTWNFVGGMILGQVSLGDPQHLLTTAITGPPAVSGGIAGMEGSVVTLILTLALCAGTALAISHDPTKVGDEPAFDPQLGTQLLKVPDQMRGRVVLQRPPRIPGVGMTSTAPTLIHEDHSVGVRVEELPPPRRST